VLINNSTNINNTGVRVWVIVFNATFNKFQPYRGGQFYLRRKAEYPDKTTDLPQSTMRTTKINERKHDHDVYR
jgi:hypothetical protein